MAQNCNLVIINIIIFFEVVPKFALKGVTNLGDSCCDPRDPRSL